jgi:hypothetical protein
MDALRGGIVLSRFLTKDFLAGVMFIAFGLTALWFGRHLAPGTTVRMGPGYVPHLLSYILLVLGFLISVFAVIYGSEPVEKPKLRPIAMVTIGLIVFALMFETTGMFPSLAALIVISSLGGDEFKTAEVIANILVLTVLCVLVFKVGLNMNIDVLRGVW